MLPQWQAREMLRTDTNRGITRTTAIGEQYLEYYEVKDSVNSVLGGSADTPYKFLCRCPVIQILMVTE